VIWNSGTGKNIHLLLEFVQIEDGIHGTAFVALQLVAVGDNHTIK